MTTVVSGFPGVGKTVFSQSRDRVLDSDSSHFSWLSKGVRNPRFPSNYMEYVKANIGSVDYILVSSHSVVRDALRENGIHYTLVYPSVELRGDYLKRYERRGTAPELIAFVEANWEPFIAEIEAETFPRLIKLGAEQFLSDLALGVQS